MSLEIDMNKLRANDETLKPHSSFDVLSKYHALMHS